MSSAFLVLGEVSLDAAQGRPGKGAPAAAVVGRLVVAYQYTFACAVGRLYALLALDALTVRLLTFVQQEISGSRLGLGPVHAAAGRTSRKPAGD